MQHSPHTRHYDEQKNESKTGTQSQAALDGNSAGAPFTGKKPDWSPLARISAVDVDTTAVVTLFRHIIHNVSDNKHDEYDDIEHAHSNEPRSEPDGSSGFCFCYRLL